MKMDAGKLRTADCNAKGFVEAVVMSKKDFQELDNPLLAWMIDYDAVATVLKVYMSFPFSTQDRDQIVLKMATKPA
jgi:hypothetical protein